MHHNVLEDVGMHYSLSVMFHVFPVVNSKRRENMAVISKDHRYIYCIHHRDNVEKEWYSPTEVRGKRKRQLIITKTTCITTSLCRRCVWDVLLTFCYVPCVPSNEEEIKHGSGRKETTATSK